MLDEAPRAGGQIYRREPDGFARSAADLYGTEAARAQAVEQQDPVGDPLGDAQGWADAYAAGDPWATGVMKALANMKVPGYAGKLPDSQAFGP